MIDSETQWMVFLVISVPAAMGILVIVGGWIAAYLEHRRVRRILSSHEENSSK